MALALLFVSLEEVVKYRIVSDVVELENGRVRLMVEAIMRDGTVHGGSACEYILPVNPKAEGITTSEQLHEALCVIVEQCQTECDAMAAEQEVAVNAANSKKFELLKGGVVDATDKKKVSKISDAEIRAAQFIAAEEKV